MTYTIRKATVDDIPIIVHHRKGMFRDMRAADDALIEAMGAPFADWVRERFEMDAYHGWFAVNPDGQVIAGVGLWILDWIPSPMAPSPPRGYLLNVYTEPEYRKQGIARRLVELTVDFCRARELTVVVLHASTQGRPIYEALGFEATNEMRLYL